MGAEDGRSPEIRHQVGGPCWMRVGRFSVVLIYDGITEENAESIHTQRSANDVMLVIQAKVMGRVCLAAEVLCLFDL